MIYEKSSNMCTRTYILNQRGDICKQHGDDDDKYDDDDSMVMMMYDNDDE